jgi:hypothetical protein
LLGPERRRGGRAFHRAIDRLWPLETSAVGHWWWWLLLALIITVSGRNGSLSQATAFARIEPSRWRCSCGEMPVVLDVRTPGAQTQPRAIPAPSS